MGPEATQANERLVGGQPVIFETDTSDTDQFGRLLRYVCTRDQNILDATENDARAGPGDLARALAA